MEIDPGTVVANRYRISRPLGRGGMGEVFAAENIRTGRPVAVKLLRSESKAKSSAVARFRREARAAGSINSDHVTEILDVEEDAEHGIVLVFELLEGESLIDRLKRTGPIPFDELFPIVEQVWIGLADAHKAGIIHRDLKPSNVFLERRPDGQTRVKILDFGISKLPKEMGGETLTEMGQSLGTFSFMPPEQIGKAKTVDHRADIYACATLIYQALSGQLPYAARNILVMVEMKSKTEARRLADAMGGDVDPRLEAFLSRALAREPAQRFQSALDALSAWRDLRPHAPSSTPQLAEPLPQPGPMAMSPHAAPPLRPAEPSIRQQPAPAANPLPMLNETTSDTAATLAMPLSHFTGGQELRRDLQAARRDSPAGGMNAVMPAAAPAGALGRTLPLRTDGMHPSAASPHAHTQQPQPMQRAPTPVPGSVRMEAPPSNAYALPPPRPMTPSGGNFAPSSAPSSSRSSSPGADRVHAGSSPGADHVRGGSSPGADRVRAGSSPGADRVRGGSSPGADRVRGGSSPGADRVRGGSSPSAVPGMIPAPHAGPSGLPRMYDEGTANPPASQEKTQIYVPQGAATGAPARRTDPTGASRDLDRPPPKRRSAAPLILGAILFALVGFGIVALILRYTGRGLH